TSRAASPSPYPLPLQGGEGRVRGSFADYQTDDLLRAAVEREFITIGEALMQAEKQDPAAIPGITNVRQIVGFRNVLVHGYAAIQHATVWGVLENDLQRLKQEVTDLLARVGTP